MEVQMPAAVGVQFTHAVAQSVAAAAGFDLLHIKGPALDPVLCVPVDPLDPRPDASPNDRHSGDADVLLRPSQAERFVAELANHHWRLDYHFDEGSNFRHAATMEHPTLAPIDIHRLFPGLGHDPEVAFDVLWGRRQELPIAGIPCWVPDVTAQRLILLLNAARAGLARSDDVRVAWDLATAQERAEVSSFAEQVGAEVALAAATGRLEAYADRRDHDLWKALATGERSRALVLRAWYRAAPDRASGIREVIRLARPRTDREAARLGRPLTLVDRARVAQRRARQVRKEGRRAVAALVRRARRSG